MDDPIQMTAQVPPSLVDPTADLIGSNSTVKFTPTPEGMACAYLSLVVMALVPIFVGSFKSIKHQVETHARSRETGEQAEIMTDRDALVFPIIASCALVGFYFLIKICPDLMNWAISGYFFALGVFAIYRPMRSATFKIFPTKYNSTQYTFLFGSKNLDSTQLQSSQSNESSEDNRSGNSSPVNSTSSSENDYVPTEILACQKFTASDILAFILAGAFGVWYIFTKHWIANNVIGIAFALGGVEMLPLNSVRVGCILLCGLFVYDVFWVFGTDVMVSVAKGFDAPIKIVFPQDFLIRGFWGKNFAMLGLGDIVIPGIFIAFLLRFDHSLKRKRNVYFWSCFLAYIFGLCLTIGVMSYFKHAQPALLYLVPCCILIPLIMAVINGDLSALLKYRDHPLPVSDDEAVDSPGDDDDSEADEEQGENPRAKKQSTRSISTRASSKKEK